ncbi:MAG: hypothetical protein AAFV29_27100, partial [Myxococcota bacterium]
SRTWSSFGLFVVVVQLESTGADLLAEAMIPELFEYNRQVNRVFGVCVDVQNTARPLARLASQMELLARNGVVHAAKLDLDLGRPLSVLTSFLSELPDQIGPSITNIERTCGQLAVAVSDCTNRIRTYYLQIRTMIQIAERHKIRVPHRRYTTINDLDELRACFETAALSETERKGVDLVYARARQNLVTVAQLVEGSQKHIEDVRLCIEELRRTTRMSRYVSQCVRVEVSQVSGQEGRFTSFADQVAVTVDILEERLNALGNLSRDGRSLLGTLAEGVSADEE